MYKEMSKDAFKHHDTWIIGFCPDTDSFFVTDQREFYWDTEGDYEFNSEDGGIKFFEDHVRHFLNINNSIMKRMCYGDKYFNNKKIYLENTHKWYEVSE